MQTIDDQLQNLLSEFDKLDGYYQPQELMDTINRDMIAREMPMTEEIFQGDIFHEERRKKLEDLEEGDIWVFNNNASRLQVKVEDYMWDNLKWYYFHQFKGGGLRIHGKVVMYIQEVTDEEIKGISISNSYVGKTIRVKNYGEYWDDYVNSEIHVDNIQKDTRIAQELQMIHRLRGFYLNNKDQIESRVNKIAEIAEDIFPGRTEMKSIFETRKDSLVSRLMDHKYLHCLIIYFPEIEITNKRDDKHTIEDLYIAISIPLDGSAGTFRGIRGKIEAKEIATNYGHSHMSGGFTSFSSFCLGTGSFSNNMEILRAGYDEELWEITLTQLLYYLKWESLSGGPYHRIQKAITGGKKDRNYMSQNEIRAMLRDLENILPDEMMENVISIKIHDSGKESTQIDIEGTSDIAEYLEDFENMEDLQYANAEIVDKSYVYVSSDNRRIGYMRISEARRHVREYKENHRYHERWVEKGFDFKGEKVVQDPYVDESLYNENYKTQIVAMNERLEKKLKSYIMMNFMNQTTQQVNQSEQQNEKHNEYKKQQEEFPEEITACTSVF